MLKNDRMTEQKLPTIKTRNLYDTGKKFKTNDDQYFERQICSGSLYFIYDTPIVNYYKDL